MVRLDREKSPPRDDGSLSHSAARHKMAVRPKRNHHASRPTRRMQEVKEEESPKLVPSLPAVSKHKPPIVPFKSSEDEQRVVEMKNKSKSLDMSLRRADQSPNSAMLKAMAVSEEKSPKATSKSETETGFLSRLFGSKRQKSSNKLPTISPPMPLAADEEIPAKLKPIFTSPNISASSAPPETGSPSYNINTSPASAYHFNTSDGRPSPPRGKMGNKPRAPPPPPNYSPPDYRRGMEQQQRKSISKSQSFRQLDGAYGDPEYPSLPVHVPNNDIILKKNKSMSSVLETTVEPTTAVASRSKFRSSVENWSFANEGLKQSIFSLADSKPIPAMNNSSHSNESLKTITSLLEEPDVLVQTRVADRSSGLSHADIPLEQEKHQKSQHEPYDLADHHSYMFNNREKNRYYDVIFNTTALPSYSNEGERRGGPTSLETLDSLTSSAGSDNYGSREETWAHITTSATAQPQVGILSCNNNHSEQRLDEDSQSNVELDSMDDSLLKDDSILVAKNNKKAASLESLDNFNEDTLNDETPDYAITQEIDSVREGVESNNPQNSTEEEITSEQVSGNISPNIPDSSSPPPEAKPVDPAALVIPDISAASEQDDWEKSEDSSEPLVLSDSSEASEPFFDSGKLETGPSDMMNVQPDVEASDTESQRETFLPPPPGEETILEGVISVDKGSNDANLAKAETLAEPCEEAQFTKIKTSGELLEPALPCQPELEPALQCQPELEPALTCQPELEPALLCQPALEPVLQCQPALEPALLCQPELETGLQCQSELEPALPCQPALEPALPCQLALEPALPYQPALERALSCQPTTSNQMITDSKNESTRDGSPIIGEIKPTAMHQVKLPKSAEASFLPSNLHSTNSASKSDKSTIIPSNPPLSEMPPQPESTQNSADIKSHQPTADEEKENIIPAPDNSLLLASEPSSRSNTSKAFQSSPVHSVLPPSDMKRQEESLKTKENSVFEDGNKKENTEKLKDISPSVTAGWTVKKPTISPKPVPAPRHFFLKPVSSEGGVDTELSTTPQSPDHSELENVFAKRSKSIRSFKEALKEEGSSSSGSEIAPFAKRSKSARNLGEIQKPGLVNNNSPSFSTEVQDVKIDVKERAKSFSGSQNLNLAPKPFRPASITQEIRANKPTNIPPKPKVAVKPTPAPRTHLMRGTVSTSHLENPNSSVNLVPKPASKSASDLLVSSVSFQSAVAKPVVVSTSHLEKPSIQSANIALKRTSNLASVLQVSSLQTAAAKPSTTVNCTEFSSQLEKASPTNPAALKPASKSVSSVETAVLNSKELIANLEKHNNPLSNLDSKPISKSSFTVQTADAKPMVNGTVSTSQLEKPEPASKSATNLVSSFNQAFSKSAVVNGFMSTSHQEKESSPPANFATPKNSSKSASDLLLSSSSFNQMAAKPLVVNSMVTTPSSTQFSHVTSKRTSKSASDLLVSSFQTAVVKPTEVNDTETIAMPSLAKARGIFSSNSSLNSHAKSERTVIVAKSEQFASHNGVNKVELQPQQLQHQQDESSPKIDSKHSSVASDNLEDIQVRKLRNNFQKLNSNIRPFGHTGASPPLSPNTDGDDQLSGRCPDKPARRKSRGKSMERPLSINLERSPIAHLDRSPIANLERSPIANLERSPVANSDRSSVAHLERSSPAAKSPERSSPAAKSPERSQPPPDNAATVDSDGNSTNVMSIVSRLNALSL